jgi:FkbM family methyltransferase
MILEDYARKNEAETFYIRPGTLDKFVVTECYSNTYFNDFMRYKPTDVVMDAGCNIAAYSTRVSKLVSRVVSYEPDAENFEIATKNLQRNGCDNVTIHNCALVGNDEPEIKFFLNKFKNKGLHSTVTKRGRDFITAKATRFSRALAESGANKLKLDIEGGEWDIFHNDVIDWSNVDSMVMEWHQKVLGDYKKDKFRWVVNYLLKHFRVVEAPETNTWASIIYASKA